MKNDPLEKDIEAKVCQYARDRGLLVYKFTSPQRASVCDRIFITRSKVFFVEFKRRGQKPTIAQARHHQDLARQDIHVYVIDNIELGKEVIEHELRPNWFGHHGSAVRVIGSDRTAPDPE